MSEVEKALLVIPKVIPSKKELPAIVDSAIKDMIESGLYNAADLYAELKWYKEASTAALACDDLISGVLEEIEKSNENHLTKFGKMDIRASSTGTQYDFTFDERWNELKTKLVEAENEVKRVKKLMADRQIHLLAVANDPDIVFDNEGIMIEKVQVIKPSRSILKVTF